MLKKLGTKICLISFTVAFLYQFLCMYIVLKLVPGFQSSFGVVLTEPDVTGFWTQFSKPLAL